MDAMSDLRPGDRVQVNGYHSGLDGKTAIVIEVHQADVVAVIAGDSWRLPLDRIARAS